MESAERKLRSDANGPDDRLVSRLRGIADRIGRIGHAYYPCCGNDRSIESAFPGAKITYLDRERPGSDFFEPVNFVLADAANYVVMPPCDLLFLLNPVVHFPSFEESLRLGGHAIANQHHQSARFLYESGKFELLGRLTYEGEWKDSGDSERYLQKVESDGEWESLCPGEYEFAKKIRKRAISEFSKIFGTDSESPLFEWVNEHVPVAKRVGDILERREGNPNDREPMDYPLYFFLGEYPGFPMKKSGGSDDLFVFRKR